MRQRGRKSAASFEIINVDGSPDRLQPPDHLSADERQRFVDIVANLRRTTFPAERYEFACSVIIEADATGGTCRQGTAQTSCDRWQAESMAHSAGKIRARTDGAFHAVAFIVRKAGSMHRAFGTTGTAFNRQSVGMVTDEDTGQKGGKLD